MTDRGAGVRKSVCKRRPRTHPRVPAKGLACLFFHGCPRLAEQVQSAALEADDEPLPGAAVSRRWEQHSGALVAALRYAVLSRPSPSLPLQPKHPDHPELPAAEFRQWVWRKAHEQHDKPRGPVPGVDYQL